MIQFFHNFLYNQETFVLTMLFMIFAGGFTLAMYNVWKSGM